ncbi:MAG TPA: A24 family peptidase [Casimicrobiaceae bacterium]|nr:A24 family peptidase [Casimicrobiaceae bacterium]
MNDYIIVENGLVAIGGGTFFTEIRLVLVVAFVAIAAVFDVRTHRIPNWLLLLGACTCIAGQMIQPALLDFGIAGALKGMAVGFALLLPLYLVRATGAGDVKLMAMVGAYLGPWGVASAALLSFIAGGVLALAVALARGAIGQLFANLRTMLFGTLLSAMTTGKTTITTPAASVGKLPYGVAIAIGTLAHAVMVQRGIALL